MRKIVKTKTKERKPNVRTNHGKTRKAPRIKKEYYTKYDFFFSRMASILQVSPGKVREIFSFRDISTIRLNPLKGDVAETLEKLKAHELELEKVDWVENVYLVKNMDKSDLALLPEYTEGLFYIQNLSSMLPALILDPKDGELIADMCAAPGSKTTHIAALTNNTAQIVANDAKLDRIQKLKGVLKQFGAKVSKLISIDATEFGKLEPDTYDKVLLDAPCSGEGMVYLPGFKPLRFWTLNKVERLSQLQKSLIISAYDAVKPGGTMVYSTCTLEPSENEAVVEYLLKTRLDAKVEQIQIQNTTQFQSYRTFVKTGITKWNKQEYSKEMNKCIRVIPGRHMQGFFVAKITKPAK